MYPFRLIILGAGFSKPAGLPLASELMPLILEEAKHRGESFEIVMNDLQQFCRYSQLRLGKEVQPEDVDIEQFMSFLDIEHYLGLKGKDTWSEDGNKSQLILRFCLAKVINDFQQQMTSSDWELYIEFVKRLSPEDRIITFNYDTLLESACEKAGVPYRLCPYRYKTVNRNGNGTLVSDPGEIIICKVHGSIDWFSRERYDREWTRKHRNPYAVAFPHPVFDHPDIYHPEPLVGNPYPKNDPLTQIYRARPVTPLFDDNERVQPNPLIIEPSSAKLIHLKPLADFWYGFNEAGYFNSQLIVIGFSFPQHDDYVMTPFVRAIDSFQQGVHKWEYFEPTKLKLVDLQLEEQAQEKYKFEHPFIDWEKTDAYWNGLLREDIDKLIEPNTFRRDKYPEVVQKDGTQQDNTINDNTPDDYPILSTASCQYNDMEGTCALDWFSGAELHELVRACGIDTDAWFPVAIRLWDLHDPQLHIYLVSEDKFHPGADSINLRAHMMGGELKVLEVVITDPSAALLKYVKRFDLLLKNRYIGAAEEFQIVKTIYVDKSNVNKTTQEL